MSRPGTTLSGVMCRNRAPRTWPVLTWTQMSTSSCRLRVCAPVNLFAPRRRWATRLVPPRLRSRSVTVKVHRITRTVRLNSTCAAPLWNAIRLLLYRRSSNCLHQLRLRSPVATLGSGGLDWPALWAFFKRDSQLSEKLWREVSRFFDGTQLACSRCQNLLSQPAVVHWPPVSTKARQSSVQSQAANAPTVPLCCTTPATLSADRGGHSTLNK